MDETPVEVVGPPATLESASAIPANDNILRARYAYVTCRSYPFAEIDAAMTEEEALWWSLQHSVFEMDSNLSFREDLPVLADDLAILRTHWARLEKARNDLTLTRHTWSQHLTGAPERSNEEQAKIDGILEMAKIQNVTDVQRKSISAIIPLEKEAEPFGAWRSTERSLRLSSETYFKEYIRALRFYYELLIQSLKKVTVNKRALNPLKQKVATANRVARAVDAAYFSIGGAKAVTHEQTTAAQKPDSRLRANGKAFIEHPYESMLRNLFDTIPYYINAPQLPKFAELIAHIIATALHDIPEDSSYDEERALEAIEKLLHHVDTAISQHISHSPNGTPVKNFLKQTLSLMTGRNNLERVLIPILRALNKNYKLSDDEIQAALLHNVADTKTPKILSTIVSEDNQDIVSDATAYDHTPPRLDFFGAQDNPVRYSLQLFEEFPESAEPKMDSFIVKLFAIADAAAESKESVKEFEPQGEDLSTIILWTTLTVKMGERCHNTDEMREGKPGYALRTVRANSTRLIPFALEILAQKQDKFGEKNFSFYNVLPRLICSTLREYEKLVGEENPELTQADHTNIANLKRWAQENPILSIDAYLEDPNTPDVIKEDMEKYRARIAEAMADNATA